MQNISLTEKSDRREREKIAAGNLSIEKNS